MTLDRRLTASQPNSKNHVTCPHSLVFATRTRIVANCKYDYVSF